MTTRILSRIILWAAPILFLAAMVFHRGFNDWFSSWFEEAAEATGVASGFDSIATAEARAAGINPSWVRAVMLIESGHDQFAVSRRGAMGLMQLMPETVKKCGLKNNAEAFRPQQNISCGVKELKAWLQKTNDLAAATQAYNGGLSCVGRCAESVQHAKKVFAAMARDAK